MQGLSYDKYNSLQGSCRGTICDMNSACPGESCMGKDQHLTGDVLKRVVILASSQAGKDRSQPRLHLLLLM